MSETAFRVGMVMFPGITQLDLTGPLEVLSSVPDWKVELVAHTMEPVVSGHGFMFPPTQTFRGAPQYDCWLCPAALASMLLYWMSSFSPSCESKRIALVMFSASVPDL
jgi:putative intracellular protease/amidase